MFAEHFECGFSVEGGRFLNGVCRMAVQWEILSVFLPKNRIPPPHLPESLVFLGQDKHVNFKKCKNSIIRFNVLFIPSGKETTRTHIPVEQLEF